MKKEWKKPIFNTVVADALKKHIQAAAWSGCRFGNFR